MEQAASMQSLAGRRILHYQIQERLGAGGMGVVYKALDLKLERPVALKFLPPHFCFDTQEKRRLEQEARAASALDHQNIGIIYGLEETEDGQIFIAMAFYEGETLTSIIRLGPLLAARSVNFATQIARGLTEAHKKGIIHRDIKPSNVIITKQELAKIVDFGLAHVTGPDLTQPASTVGTAAYMSPEQAHGYPVDHRTDIWSLGVVLYEMLTGELPFSGNSMPALLHSVIYERTPDLSGRFPPQLNAIVQRALSKDPANRYASVADMGNELAALERIVAESEDTQAIGIYRPEQPSISQPRRRKIGLFTRFFSRVRNRIVAATLLILLLVGAALVVKFVSGRYAGQWPRRLVVLPFTNISHDAADDALCDGLMEVLTSKLTSLEQLQNSLSVVPSSEVRRRKVDSPEGARNAFNANLVVEGTVNHDTGGVRLNIDLVDPNDVRQLGSATFTQASSDLATIEDKAIARLTELLEVNVKPKTLKAAVLNKGPNVPAAYETYLKGVGLEQRYDNPLNLDKAINLFRQSLEIDPKFALAYAKLGEAYWLKYKSIDQDPQLLRRSRENANRALALDSQLPSAYVTLGSLDDGEGHHELAVEEFQRALQLDTRNVPAYQGLGRAYESLGRAKEAEAMLQKAIDLDPDSWDGHSRLGTFYFRQARYEEAVTQFRRVLQLVPDDSLAYSNLGGALLKTGQTQEAAKMFMKSNSLAPSYAAYSNLGYIYYYRDRKYADALRMYEKAAAINNKDYIVWANIARCYGKLRGSNEKKKAAYQRASRAIEQYLQENSRDADALCDLALAKAHLGQEEEVERLLRKALALAPENPQVERAAAIAFESAGDQDRALSLISAALQHGARAEDLGRDPDLDTLSNNPRFAATLSRQGKNDVQH